MSDSQSWPRIVVVGAGAVGGYFGGRLAQAGAPVVLIGRKAFVDAVNAHGLIIEQAAGEQAVKVEATADIGAVADAELVLFCVKSNDTVSSAKEIAPLLAPNALVICLQNGVDNKKGPKWSGSRVRPRRIMPRRFPVSAKEKPQMTKWYRTL